MLTHRGCYDCLRFAWYRYTGAAKQIPTLATAGDAMDIESAVTNLCPRAHAGLAAGLQDACLASGLTSPLVQAHFLAQLASESGGLVRLEENLNYSAQRLAEVWPSRYAIDPKAKSKLPNALATSLAGNPQQIAIRTYANRNGNGDAASGDGWTFRGRGLIQLTGRGNYAAASRAVFNDDRLVGNPDLVEQPDGAAKIAVWFWNSRNISVPAARDDLKAVTMLVNGGDTGLADRLAWLNRFKAALI
jgi:putative chitinase